MYYYRNTKGSITSYVESEIEISGDRDEVEITKAEYDAAVRAIRAKTNEGDAEND